MSKKNATRQQKWNFLLELRCQWLENGKSLDKVSVKRLRHLYKVGTVPKDQLVTLLEKGAITDQLVDEFEDMVTEYFRKGNERRNAKNNEPQPVREEVLPGFENEPKPEPVQTAIDFDKERIADNLGELIIIARKVADALEKISETAVLLGKCCGDFRGVGPGGLLVENYKFDVNVSQ